MPAHNQVIHAPLSGREQTVLRLIALGHSGREIGERLGISRKTVDTYRARMSIKLESRTRAELVQHALRLGLLTRT